MIPIKFSDLSREPGGTLRILNYMTPPRAPSRGALCSLVLAVSTKALFLFFPPVLCLPVPSATAPVCACACVLTVTRCYICSSALSPYRVKLWASAFGGEIKSIAAKYSGSQLLQKVRFLWWQEAMIFFPAQKMEADLVFQTNVNPEQHQLSEVSLILRCLGNVLCQ